jgi:uroporphyrinogen-III decarboxylase
MMMAAMTSRERIESAVRLGKPDRVPVAPLTDFFSARYGGINQHEMLFDIEKADRALLKTLGNLGWPDGLHFSWAGLGQLLLTIFPTSPLVPGLDGFPEDNEFQFVEKPVMEPEEYLRIEEVGVLRWLLEKLRLNHPELRSLPGMARTGMSIGMDTLKLKRSIKGWQAKGIEPLVGTNLSMTPMEAISMGFRSYNHFVLDLFRYPQELKAASRALINPLKNLGRILVMSSGIKRVFLGGARTSASCMSPGQFEEFALPEWQEMCEYYTRLGITPLLHLDSDWTAFFPYFKSLPRGKCILNLDGTSDIFKAKEVLGDHMCIMGDVPAALLKLGEPEEVDEYCRRLITEVGGDGGFILSSGCSIPIDAKPENVAAMLRSVKRYKP